MILVTGSVNLKPETRAEAFKIGCEHSQRSRGEAGCFGHNCMVDAEDENRMCFHEVWRDMAALQTHFRVPASGEFVKQVSALAAEPPKIEIFEAEAIKVAPF